MHYPRFMFSISVLFLFLGIVSVAGGPDQTLSANSSPMAEEAKAAKQSALQRLRAAKDKMKAKLIASKQTIAAKAKDIKVVVVEKVATGLTSFGSQLTNFVTAISKSSHCEVTTRKCDLNALWKEKCSGKNREAEWQDSLFCALGSGDRLAMLIFRLRFTVPDTPEEHAFSRIMTKDLVATMRGINESLPGIIDKWFAKVKQGELLQWSDFPAFLFLVETNKSVQQKLEESINEHGLSFAGSRAKVPLEPPMSVDLNKLRDTKCIPGENTWHDTDDGAGSKSLFCALAFSKEDHLMARLLAKWKFTAPKDYRVHFIQRILDAAVYPNVKKPDPKTGKQSWKMWAIEKGLNYQLSTVTSKLSHDEVLEWNDISSTLVFGSVLGIGGFNVQWLVEPYVLPYMNKHGLDLAPE